MSKVLLEHFEANPLPKEKPIEVEAEFGKEEKSKKYDELFIRH